MSEVAKKVAYLKGMAEGMNLTEDSVQNRLLLRMLEALEEIADELDAVEARQDEAEQYIDELDADLGEVEEFLFADDEDDDECDCGCGHHHHNEDDEDEEWDEEDEDEEEGMDFIEYECPHCKTCVYYDQEAFDLEEEHLCPECGKELFPTTID